ncbi:DUF433 domain-containing protein [Calidifontibacillus erzurumensis]|nr:DUF433 domain-containing protein [Calidifontibacillus erzurumensis]
MNCQLLEYSRGINEPVSEKNVFVFKETPRIFTKTSKKKYPHYLERGLKSLNGEYTVYQNQLIKNRKIEMIGKQDLEFLGKQYLEILAKKSNGINVSSNILGGMPVVKGTRINVSLILACLRDEMTIEEICEDYSLEYEDVFNALNFVIKVLDYPYYEE